MEGVYDTDWARTLGIDTDEIYVLMPRYGEQAVDMVADYVQAEDVGLVVVDSLSAIVAAKIIDESAEDSFPAINARLMGRMVEKTTDALNEAKRHGREPALLYINQIRTNLNVRKGSPESIPGGHRIRFQSNLTFRLWGKHEMDKTLSTGMPAWLHQTGIVKKNRVRVIHKFPDWDVSLLRGTGIPIGATDDWGSMLKWMRKLDLITKQGKVWATPIGDFSKQDDAKKVVRENMETRDELARVIIAEMDRRAIEAGGTLEFE
jgi:hypothetical protein